jgi:hypothetical protein
MSSSLRVRVASSKGGEPRSEYQQWKRRLDLYPNLWPVVRDFGQNKQVAKHLNHDIQRRHGAKTGEKLNCLRLKLTPRLICSPSSLTLGYLMPVCGRLSKTLIVTARRTLSCVHSVCIGDKKICIILTQEMVVLSQEYRQEFRVLAKVPQIGSPPQV